MDFIVSPWLRKGHSAAKSGNFRILQQPRKHWTCTEAVHWLTVGNYLSFLAFSASALNLDEFSTANLFLSSICLCSDSPRGLLAMAFTAVNGTAEKTRTPASLNATIRKSERSVLHQIRQTGDRSSGPHTSCQAALQTEARPENICGGGPGVGGREDTWRWDRRAEEDERLEAGCNGAIIGGRGLGESSSSSSSWSSSFSPCLAYVALAASQIPFHRCHVASWRVESTSTNRHLFYSV